jgi:hypothetical protein
MPKRTDIRSIMIIGAGPIVIGQACEFDYSGAQACKALREEGYRVILVNSNPATIMTDPGWPTPPISSRSRPRWWPRSSRRSGPTRSAHHGRADRAQHLARARGNGGAGEVRRRDDRRQARGHRDGRGPQAVPRGDGPDRAGKPQGHHRQRAEARHRQVRHQGGLAQAMEALEEIGLPAIIRPAFTLGGTGGGVAYNREEYEHYCRTGMEASPVAQILVDESLLGWKEFEMEVVRDKADNASSSVPSRTWTRWACTRATRSPWPRADADRQGIPDDAQRLDRRAARDRGGDRRLQRAMGREPRGRAHGGDRDEPPRVAGPPRWRPRPRASPSPRSRRSWPWATRSTSSTTTSPR